MFCEALVVELLRGAEAQQLEGLKALQAVTSTPSQFRAQLVSVYWTPTTLQVRCPAVAHKTHRHAQSIDSFSRLRTHRP